MTAERRFNLNAQAHTVGVRFRPGMAASFLRLGAEELTDRVLPLEKSGLAERLANAESAAECRRILIAALRPPADAPNGVQRAIEAVTSSHGDVNLEWIARQAGMSERQFRRRCVEESGLSPKQLCRVLRFRHACTLGRRGLPWGLIAAEAGYFDQAHLIRDFREFTGNTPMSVFSNTGDGHSG
jgi:AraC-like DNA-binding protein